MHCGRYVPLFSRRDMLRKCANGFGAVALAGLLHDQAKGAPAINPLAPRPSHYPAKARSVIFLYMDGGPSQMDTFDPKPRLRASMASRSAHGSSRRNSTTSAP